MQEINKRIALVQCYIHAMKNVEVNILYRPQDAGLLDMAYLKAYVWAKQNNIAIRLV